jgi:hypothetical protein
MIATWNTGRSTGRSVRYVARTTSVSPGAIVVAGRPLSSTRSIAL